MICFEYFLDENNYITGWTQWNSQRNQDFEINPYPLEEMKLSLIDEFGNYKFQLINNAIVYNPISPTEHQLSLSEITKTHIFKIIKSVINGIETEGQGISYLKLKEIVDKIQNGI